LRVRVYGTRGSAAPANTPGARSFAVSWSDKKGHFWLFGGNGYDATTNPDTNNLNDLWRFTPETSEWTWMGGSQTGGVAGVYGELGVPSPGNMPGAKSSAVSWTDKSGDIWVFGGTGVDAAGNDGELNDLWRLDPEKLEWTWMGGSNAIGSPGVYGALGTPSPGSVPSSRSNASGWTDSSGNFWLFGGSAYSAGAGTVQLNDLWEYKPSHNQWIWIGGSNAFGAANGQPGVYGTQGEPAAANIPGGRADASVWADCHGDLWLFGGHGIDSTGAIGELNDLWKFSVSSRQWTWMGGSETLGTNAGQFGVYGTLGVPSLGNSPGGRDSALTWTDHKGNFWMFGGGGFYSATGATTAGKTYSLDDLWEFDPKTNEWTWWSGNSTSDGGENWLGIYGVLHRPALSNLPGGRANSVGWIDHRGLWLFGGVGNDSTASTAPCPPFKRCTPQTVPNNGDLNDLWVYQPFLDLPVAATPLITPAAGTYSTDQTVMISDATPGAAIYYTTDGTPPFTHSTLYDGPITVSSTETLNAVAIGGGYLISDTATAAYTIDLGLASTPE
jgi:N-acetylneuraminic acid mutarotase